MTVATWPASLPLPERPTWKRQPQEARLKRQPDVGPVAYRRRFSAVAEPVSLSVMLDRDQKAEFDRFFRDTLAYGSKPFWMADPTTDGWQLYTDTGAPLLTEADVPVLLSELWLCQMGDEQPAEAIVGLEFRISFSVTVMP